MTVIRPNSVSGITSITAQANEIIFFRSNGTLAGLQLNGVNFNTTTGISTLAALKITGNLDVEGVLTYQDVTNVDSVGIVTARQGVRVTADGSPSSNYISVGASNDLKIYHSGSHSRILDDATGKLQLGSDTEVEILNGSFNESMAKFQPNGAVELYHNNSKKFDTITTGIRVHGDEGGTAQLQLLADQGDDNADYWRFIAETDGTLNMQDYGSGNWYNNIRLNGHTGGVELYHDNEKKLYTYGEGVFIQDDSSAGAYLVLATNAGTQGSLYGTANTLGFLDGQNHYMLKGVKDGTVELYFDNSKKFETLSSGAKVSGALNVTTQISSGDITITSSQPMLFLQDNGNDPDWSVKNGNGNFFIRDETNSAVRFAINQNSNIEFYGDAVPSANNTHDLGTTSLRWRNIYTNDLNLSNEGGKNNVDGTWGNYTIQEGESDLFLINNRNGKKYKFNLTEVS